MSQTSLRESVKSIEACEAIEREVFEGLLDAMATELQVIL